ncbi:hypothetical protein ABG067_004753 [Albugo candida]
MSEGNPLHYASNVVRENANKKNPHLPLPDNYFQPPALSQEEKKYLITLAKRACKEVVCYSRPCQGPVQWIHLCTEEGGVEVYQGVDQTSKLSVHSGSIKSRNLTYLRGVAKVYATIDEIAEFFKLDTPEKIRSYQQTITSDTLDNQTLYHLALPTPRNPHHYVGVKWSAIESPSKLARNRDFSYIEGAIINKGMNSVMMNSWIQPGIGVDGSAACIRYVCHAVRVWRNPTDSSQGERSILASGPSDASAYS